MCLECLSRLVIGSSITGASWRYWWHIWWARRVWSIYIPGVVVLKSKSHNAGKSTTVFYWDEEDEERWGAMIVMENNAASKALGDRG